MKATNNNAIPSQNVNREWMDADYIPGLVSVIIPTYNRSQLLVKAMDSVWQQTYRPIELLIVDDGSTDDTSDVVTSWISNHEENGSFRAYYIHQANSGAPAARNLGLIKSKGEYLQFLDSDDILYERRLEIILEVFRQDKQCDCIHSGFDIMCGKCGQVMSQYIPQQTENALESAMLNKLWGNTWNFTERRSLSLRIGPWDESLTTGQDRDYTYRRLLYADKTRIVAESLYGCQKGIDPQISDRRYTHEGWSNRLKIEKRFCDIIRKRADIHYEAKSVYSEKLFYIGVRLYGEGYENLGKEYGQLALSLGCASLSPGGERMRKLWQAGKYVCTVWTFGRNMKNRLQDVLNVGRKKHICAN